MIWTSISDIHIKPHDLESQQILNSFLEKSLELKAEKIFLLGDIFDLMVGSHREYLDQYPNLFGKMAELMKRGVELYFFEGNHDFHLRGLWKAFSERFNVSEVVYIKDHLVLTCGSKKILLSHGDNSDKEDLEYRLYKGFIRSKFIKILSTNIVPHKIVDGIGVWASGKSRKYSGAYEVNERIRDKYRKIAEYEANKYGADVVVAGHSHIEDIHQFGDRVYINNGMSLKKRKFVLIKQNAPVVLEKIL